MTQTHDRFAGQNLAIALAAVRAESLALPAGYVGPDGHAVQVLGEGDWKVMRSAAGGTWVVVPDVGQSTRVPATAVAPTSAAAPTKKKSRGAVVGGIIVVLVIIGIGIGSFGGGDNYREVSAVHGVGNSITSVVIAAKSALKDTDYESITGKMFGKYGAVVVLFECDNPASTRLGEASQSGVFNFQGTKTGASC